MAPGGTRIGDQFLFIEALGDVVRLSRRKTAMPVCIFLEFGQVVQLWGKDFLRLPAYLRDACLFRELAVVVELYGRFPVMELVGTAHLQQCVFLVHADVNRPAVGSDMVLTFPVTVADGSEYGRLYPSQRVIAQPGRLAYGVARIYPSIQSALFLLSEARNRLSNILRGSRFSMPFRTASSVRDEIQRRRTGCLHPKYPYR